MPSTQTEPVVVYAVVSLIVAAVILGLLFASPLRQRLTGPDDSAPSDDGGASDDGAGSANDAVAVDDAASNQGVALANSLEERELTDAPSDVGQPRAS